MTTFKSERGAYKEEDDDNVYFWRVETLWRVAEELPVEHLTLDEIYWAQDSCAYLEYDDTYMSFALHVKRVVDSDLSYPVIISPSGSVMDGMHRLVKAFVSGVSLVKAVRFSEMPPSDYIQAKQPE